MIDPEGTRAVWHDICDRRAGSSVGVDACVTARWIGHAESTLAASQNKFGSLLNEKVTEKGAGRRPRAVIQASGTVGRFDGYRATRADRFARVNPPTPRRTGPDRGPTRIRAPFTKPGLPSSAL